MSPRVLHSQRLVVSLNSLVGQVGDYIEFLAETDLLVSASTCPGGDMSAACGAEGQPATYGLDVEVWQPEEGWLASDGWEPSELNGYKGKHGL